MGENVQTCLETVIFAKYTQKLRVNVTEIIYLDFFKKSYFEFWRFFVISSDFLGKAYTILKVFLHNLRNLILRIYKVISGDLLYPFFRKKIKKDKLS